MPPHSVFEAPPWKTVLFIGAIHPPSREEPVISNELGDFLRARRQDRALAPDHDTPGARRTPGLRREEVATRAGISVDYYIRLEQGRESHPSDAVISALADALALSPDAARHLVRLRDANAAPAEPTADTDLVPRMSALVAAVRPQPAYVLDRFSTIVAANEEGMSLYAGLAELPPEQRNTCRYLLTDPRARETFLDWEDLARGAVAHLRAANVDRLDDPRLGELVRELGARSEQFAAWWGGHIVERRRGATTRIRGLDGVVVERSYEILHLPDDAVRLTIWLPPAA
ncbi:helix-turn-helix transcriptional regulator [Microbacterium neimengense]